MLRPNIQSRRRLLLLKRGAQRVRYLASWRHVQTGNAAVSYVATSYRMYNSNFVVWIMCNDALGQGGKGNGRRIWPVPRVEKCLPPSSNVINNRGGGGPFPWWPLQATTPLSRPIAEIFNSSNGLELVAVRKPTCRSRIRIGRLSYRSCGSWLLLIFLPQVRCMIFAITVLNLSRTEIQSQLSYIYKNTVELWKFSKL